MKKILLYAAVPFFLHFALLNTRDCIRKIRGQNGPVLYREHTPAMKKLRQIADWRSGRHLKYRTHLAKTTIDTTVETCYFL